jgi:hypothetical protein
MWPYDEPMSRQLAFFNGTLFKDLINRRMKKDLPGALLSE